MVTVRDMNQIEKLNILLKTRGWTDADLGSRLPGRFGRTMTRQSVSNWRVNGRIAEDSLENVAKVFEVEKESLRVDGRPLKRIANRKHRNEVLIEAAAALAIFVEKHNVRLTAAQYGRAVELLYDEALLLDGDVRRARISDSVQALVNQKRGH